MTKKEKFAELVDTLNGLAQEVGTPQVEMSEATEQDQTMEQKIDFIYNFLTEDVDEDIEEPQVEMSEAPEVEEVTAEEVEAVLTTEVEEPDYKKLYEELQAQKEEVVETPVEEPKVEAVAEPVKVEVKPEVIHNPEAQVEQAPPTFGSKGAKIFNENHSQNAVFNALAGI